MDNDTRPTNDKNLIAGISGRTWLNRRILPERLPLDYRKKSAGEKESELAQH